MVQSTNALKGIKIEAYLDLIQELLACPQGEEWILLRKYRELVNSELVTVMEWVANYLMNSGDTKAATYLHNWAGKLHHILMENISVLPSNNDKAQDYLELIQALLSCPEGRELEVLTAHQNLVDPELVRAMNNVARQMQPRDPETANYLFALAEDLDHTWIEHHQFEPIYKPEIAPDPWLEEDRASFEPVAIAPEIKTQIQTDLTTPSTITNNDRLTEILAHIASSLIKLETIISAREQAGNPLWYMDVLDKAIASNWILTTDEVEKLIGVKPHCSHDETSFTRGSWIFTKAGKVGAQTGWRVSKQVGE